MAAPSWNPGQYGKFAEPRLRPGLDLIARLPDDVPPSTIVDLGCGTGRLTALLAARWPGARIIGIDRSPAMLAEAQAAFPALDWREGDIADWAERRPDGPVDLIYSNAALQWLGDHPALFRRLADALAPGGVLAVQMPRNFAAASHRVLRETVAEGGWSRPIPIAHETVLAMADYHDLLAPACGRLELWQTDYLHVLDGPDPVFQWLRGTALLPVVQALDGVELDRFLERCRQRLAEAYPRRPNGQTLFPFSRLFLLARR